MGEYPDLASLAQIECYKPYQLDFGQRLIGKFRFCPQAFWHDDNFPYVPRAALYPQSKDWLETTAETIRTHVKALS